MKEPPTEAARLEFNVKPHQSVCEDHFQAGNRDDREPHIECKLGHWIDSLRDESTVKKYG